MLLHMHAHTCTPPFAQIKPFLPGEAMPAMRHHSIQQWQQIIVLQAGKPCQYQLSQPASMVWLWSLPHRLCG